MNGVIFTLEVIAIVFAVDGTWLLFKYLRARKLLRPDPPDVFLPDGWLRWFPDGRGYSRLYEWHRGAWRELPNRKFRIRQEEPADG